MKTYLQCKFSNSDSRSYTYHLPDYISRDEVHNLVVVMTNDGLRVVRVVDVHNKKPDFETKPIVATIDKQQVSQYAKERRGETQ